MVILYTDKQDFSSLPPKVAATVGFFDGVHRGHRFLIEQLQKSGKEKKLPTAVVTFPVHPRKVLDNGFCPELLNSFEEKLSLLESTGADYCFVMNFTRELSQLSAQDFIQQVLFKQLNVQSLLVGYDHRFGKDRKDGIKAYMKYGKQVGMDVIEAASLYVEGQHVSSTRIRKLLSLGDVKTASLLLSYPYKLEGIVVVGNQLGRSIGFPTANIHISNPEKIIPSVGIYAVWVYVSIKKYMGMLYIGSRPTIENINELRIEVNLLDFSDDLYNQTISIELIEFLRKDEKFASLEALKNQLILDKENTQKILG